MLIKKMAKQFFPNSTLCCLIPIEFAYPYYSHLELSCFNQINPFKRLSVQAKCTTKKSFLLKNDFDMKDMMD